MTPREKALEAAVGIQQLPPCPRYLKGAAQEAAWAELAKRCQDGLAAIKAAEDALKPTAAVAAFEMGREG